MAVKSVSVAIGGGSGFVAKGALRLRQTHQIKTDKWSVDNIYDFVVYYELLKIQLSRVISSFLPYNFVWC